MEESLYQQWWPLHLRVARGETLAGEEQARYELGLRQMEQDERTPVVIALRQSRATLDRLRGEHAELAAREQQLDAEVAALEASLDPQTRRLLGLEN